MWDLKYGTNGVLLRLGLFGERSTVGVSQSKLDGVADARRLQLLIDAIVDYAIYMIDVDGTVRSWNAGARATEGLLGHEIIGKPFSLFIRQRIALNGFPKPH